MTELSKAYNPTETESKIYQLWEKSGFFNPDKLPDADQRKPYTIIMPPPNATGILHAGHALFLTVEDIFTRFERMRGRKTLWLPGTDHAAIATQARVEKDIYKKEGKNRQDLGREELLRRIDAFVQEHRSIMVGQMRAMGASCDWSREAFTLDEQRNHAVAEAFKRLYDLGLIYRGNRIINWDPKGQTTISDDEIVYEERPAKLYTFRYNKDFPIPISTTRPETKVGDTAVAVHPDDTRYQKYIGKEYDLNFCGVALHIKIVADSAADPEFGTGAVGVTPAHSMSDWEIAQRHDLPVKPVINEYARMTVESPELNEKKTLEAREVILAWLSKEGLLEKEEDITQNIATAERTGGVIEPLPKLQWFIGVNKPFKIPHSEIDGISSGQEVTLKQLMRHVVESGQIKIVPEHFTNTYFHWIDNLRDWCISRQIWYGHPVPVWYKRPSKAIQITFLTHGSTPDNENNESYTGNPDIGLSELGRQQSIRQGELVKDRDFDIVITSNLKRATETAELTFKGRNIEMVQDVRLREIEIGKKPLSSEELREGLRKNINQPFPDGESLEDVKSRMISWLLETSDRYPGKKIAIIAHRIPQLVLEILLKDKTWQQAFDEDWRKDKNLWQPGWDYEFKELSYVNVRPPKGSNWTQDSDTLDTWFSSGLWTFSTLGWPETTTDLKTFHPTDIMETAYEILFFWVARMILMTASLVGQVPFRTVYLHGLVRDEKRQKLSKSKADSADPLDLIAKFGTDALRMALVFNTAPGTDSILSEEKIKGMKHFANKLWNISRYVLMNASESKVSAKGGSASGGESEKSKVKAKTEADKVILGQLDKAVEEVTKNLETFQIHEAAQVMYQFTWREFADVYLEASKPQLNDPDLKENTHNTLYLILNTVLRLLHPFMPFVTEEIWSQLPAWEDKQLLIVEEWPR